MRIAQLENEISARIKDVNRDYISKDKIREKIEEYKAKKEGLDIIYRKDDIVNVLRELL